MRMLLWQAVLVASLLALLGSIAAASTRGDRVTSGAGAIRASVEARPAMTHSVGVQLVVNTQTDEDAEAVGDNDDENDEDNDDDDDDGDDCD